MASFVESATWPVILLFGGASLLAFLAALVLLVQALRTGSASAAVIACIQILMVVGLPVTTLATANATLVRFAAEAQTGAVFAGALPAMGFVCIASAVTSGLVIGLLRSPRA
jgi:hypothetical protein